MAARSGRGHSAPCEETCYFEMYTAAFLVEGCHHIRDTRPDGALAIDSTALKLLSFHSTEFASPELCCSATTGATADREQACRAPGGEQDRQPPTPRGAGVVAVPWDRAGELPVRVPAVTPIFLSRTCGRTQDRIRLDGTADVLELCGQAEVGAAGA